jgi:hypothetical protein
VSSQAEVDRLRKDVVGRIYLADGSGVSVITGIDDHSRFCMCARLVPRATAPPVCDALAWAMRTHGAPRPGPHRQRQGVHRRFGKGPGPVLFDRICADNGIRHLLTTPYSPTITGKVQRFHKTRRAKWVRPNDRAFATLAESQTSLDAWVEHYNTERPNRSCGGPPAAGAVPLGRWTPHPRSRRDARRDAGGVSAQRTAERREYGRDPREDDSGGPNQGTEAPHLVGTPRRCLTMGAALNATLPAVAVAFRHTTSCVERNRDADERPGLRRRAPDQLRPGCLPRIRWDGPVAEGEPQG